ncbi:MAG: hypothetical protein WEA09_05360 [Gemmatimonadota bacterium]
MSVCRRTGALLGIFGLVLSLGACGPDGGSGDQELDEGGDPASGELSGLGERTAVFDIAGERHELAILCFVTDTEMQVSSVDDPEEQPPLPDGVGRISFSADFTEDMNRIIAQARNDASDSRNLYQWVVRDDEGLGEFLSVEIDHEARTAVIEAVFHNNSRDEDVGEYASGEEREGRVLIRC